MHKDKECLTDLELGAYLEGRLSPDRKEEVEQIIAECPACLSEVLLVSRMLSESPLLQEVQVPEQILEKTVSLAKQTPSAFDAVLSLVKDAIRVIGVSSGTEWSYPLPMFELRHAKTVSPQMVTLNKIFEGIRAELNIEQRAECLCNLKVSVTTTTPDLTLQAIRVALFSGDRELESDFLADGQVLFEDIGCGSYVVSIRKKEALLGELTLKIK